MTEIENILLSAQAEIRLLRQTNQILEAKVSTMDKMHNMLMAEAPRYGASASVDVCWQIQKALDNMKEDTKKSDQP